MCFATQNTLRFEKKILPVIWMFYSFCVAWAVMVYICKQWIETSNWSMCRFRSKIHINAVYVHDVDGFHDILRWKPVSKFQSFSQKLNTVFLNKSQCSWTYSKEKSYEGSFKDTLISKCWNRKSKPNIFLQKCDFFIKNPLKIDFKILTKKIVFDSTIIFLAFWLLFDQKIA